jgi:dTDP-4-dehydrorhamnose 3,5-epimerase
VKFVSTDLPGVVIAEPQVFRDERGFLMETWHAKKFADAGIHETFVQDNHTRSAYDPLAARRRAYAVLDKAATIADFGLTPIHWRMALHQMLAELAHA